MDVRWSEQFGARMD